MAFSGLSIIQTGIIPVRSTHSLVPRIISQERLRPVVQQASLVRRLAALQVRALPERMLLFAAVRLG
jgi:hypothetical protein